MRTAYLSALAIASSSAVLVSGCKKKSKTFDQERTVQTMSEFRDKMCTCKDKTCADRVHVEFNKWSADMAAKAAKLEPARPDEALMKRMVDIGTQYGECMTKAMSTGDTALAVDPPDAARPDVPPPPANPNDATQALRTATIWARENSRSALGHIAANYVDEEGMLDPDDGTLELWFGFDRSDDPKRRTGAPVKEPTFANQCFGLTLAKGAWTRRNDISCGKTFRAPTCSITDVWKRALAAKAPSDAVAVITYDEFSGKTMWLFNVTDPVRQIDFKHLVADDCPLEVEK